MWLSVCLCDEHMSLLGPLARWKDRGACRGDETEDRRQTWQTGGLRALGSGAGDYRR